MGEVPKSGPEEELRQGLEMDLEVSEEAIERWQEQIKEIRDNLLDDISASSTRESIPLFPAIPDAPLTFPGFDDLNPEEREVVRKIILKEVFQVIGFDPTDPKVIEEYPDKTYADGKERQVRVFATQVSNLSLVYDGEDFWLRKEEEKAENMETITFRGECDLCGTEIVIVATVPVPKEPKIKRPKRGKPYYDVDYPEVVPCPKGCTVPDPDDSSKFIPRSYQLYERRYVGE